MNNKKLILIPAAAAERICPLRPEYRLLSAVGQFEPRRMNCWYPVQSYFLTTQSVDEANAEDGATSPLPDENIQTGDVVEIDTGLGQFFFYCVTMRDFRPAFFDVRRIQTGKIDDTEVS